jgi:predicted nuclease with RNAse H fold
MPDLVVAGIDVGGTRKGFHAVALNGRDCIDCFASCDPAAVVRWCVQAGAQAVGVDAPCGWCIEGKGRLAERQLRELGINSFWSPTETDAINHRQGFYGWMLNGARLYVELRGNYLLYDGTLRSGLLCFETFPHAVAWAMNSGIKSQKSKVQVRRDLLSVRLRDTSRLKNLDLVDAALCALTAQCLVAGETDQFGDSRTGYIVTPRMD